MVRTQLSTFVLLLFCIAVTCSYRAFSQTKDLLTPICWKCKQRLGSDNLCHNPSCPESRRRNYTAPSRREEERSAEMNRWREQERVNQETLRQRQVDLERQRVQRQQEE